MSTKSTIVLYQDPYIHVYDEMHDGLIHIETEYCNIPIPKEYCCQGSSRNGSDLICPYCGSGRCFEKYKKENKEKYCSAQALVMLLNTGKDNEKCFFSDETSDETGEVADAININPYNNNAWMIISLPKGFVKKFREQFEKNRALKNEGSKKAVATYEAQNVLKFVPIDGI